jgi:tRNA 2-thiouridine synthesizing protein B
MATLHTVNKSPFERNALQSCIAHLSSGDVVLLIEDAVVGARKSTSVAQSLAARQADARICALGPDLAARGLKQSDLIDGVEIVDYRGFVELAAGSDRVCSWL